MARPSRQLVFERLERAVDELDGVGGLPLPDEARAIWSGIWHEETHHSTAMEGNTLVLKEVQLLLDEGRAVGSKEMKAYLEVQGYGKAAEWVYAQAVRNPPRETQCFVRMPEVREIHRLAVEPVWLHFPPEHLVAGEGPGNFRRHDIEPFSEGMTPPEWTQLHSLVSDWIDKVNAGRGWDQSRHAMEDFADLHAEFERTHPFLDGNGRVGRLILNLLLVRFGYPPAVIYKKDRDAYLRGLRRADAGDPGSLAEVLSRAVKYSVDRFILPGLAGPHKYVPLSALTGWGLSHNALILAAQRGRLQATQKNGQWYSTQRLVMEYKQSRYRRTRKVRRQLPSPSRPVRSPH
jgi:hypothetical protein